MEVSAHVPEFIPVPENIVFPYPTAYPHQVTFIEHSHENILLQSSTCSGKTAAYLGAHLSATRKDPRRNVTLYLVPNRLLAISQALAITSFCRRQGFDPIVLRPGLSAAELMASVQNPVVVSSPDIIFYMLLRRARGWSTAFDYWLDTVRSICFDELHLYDDYTMFNIANMVNAVKTAAPEISVYVLTATADLGPEFPVEDFFTLTGAGQTWPVKTEGVDVDYWNLDILEAWLSGVAKESGVVYVCNSVKRARLLRERFPGAAWLVGKIHYDPSEGDPEEQILREIEKCTSGVFTIATSVIRQGVDLDMKMLITEEPRNSQDALQTFGRCGRREGGSRFIVLTGKRSLLDFLNAPVTMTRARFEQEFARFFRPADREAVTSLALACWYELYEKTDLKSFIKPTLEPKMAHAHEIYKRYLPDVSFRDPLPSLECNGMQIGLFDVLQYRDAHKYIFPHAPRHRKKSFTIGRFTGHSRLVSGRFSVESCKNRPRFVVKYSEEVPGMDLVHLHLQLGDLKFRINARVGKRGQFPWTMRKPRWPSRLGVEYSFEPSNLGYRT